MLLLLPAAALTGLFNRAYEPGIKNLYESDLERKLFKRLSLSKSISRALYKAALIASGVKSKQDIQKYRRRLRTLFISLKSRSASMKNRYRRSREILKLLHQTVLRQYRSTRTTLLNVFNSGEFNCVSSAFLFNTILNRLGYKTRAVTIPGHVYSQVYIAGRWIDVETTMRKGFDPMRRNGMPSIAGDRQFVPEKGDRSKRRFINNIKFVALFYYNRATISFSSSDSSIPFRLLYKAMKIYPQHRASEKNLTAVIVNWGTALIRSEKSERATAIAIEGIRMLGGKTVFYKLIQEALLSDARSAARRNNYKEAIKTLYRLVKLLPLYRGKTIQEIQGYYARWAQHLLKENKLHDMLYVINSASKKWRSSFFKEFKIHLVSRGALHFFQSSNPAGGLSFYNRNIPIYREGRAARINRQYLYTQWAQYELEKKNFEKAYAAYSSGLRLYPRYTAFRLGQNRTADLWRKELLHSAAQPAVWISRSYSLYNRYRNPRFLHGIISTIEKYLARMIRSRRFEKAFLLLDKLRYQSRKNPALPSCDRLMIHLLSLWGKSCIMEKNFKKGIEVYKKGLTRYPGTGVFTTPLTSAYHRYVRQLLENNRYKEGKRMLLEALHRFPAHKELLQIKSYFASSSR